MLAVPSTYYKRYRYLQYCTPNKNKIFILVTTKLVILFPLNPFPYLNSHWKCWRWPSMPEKKIISTDKYVNRSNEENHMARFFQVCGSAFIFCGSGSSGFSQCGSGFRCGSWASLTKLVKNYLIKCWKRPNRLLRS